MKDYLKNICRFLVLFVFLSSSNQVLSNDNYLLNQLSDLDKKANRLLQQKKFQESVGILKKTLEIRKKI